MPDPMGTQSCPGGGIRPARIEEAAALSDLCVRSKAVWGYDESFMTLARGVLQVGVKEIAAGDIWVATTADGSIAGVVALAPGEQRARSTSTSSSSSRGISGADLAARCSTTRRRKRGAGAQRG
jgi:hypothetical protein